MHTYTNFKNVSSNRSNSDIRIDVSSTFVERTLIHIRCSIAVGYLKISRLRTHQNYGYCCLPIDSAGYYNV